MSAQENKVEQEVLDKLQQNFVVTMVNAKTLFEELKEWFDNQEKVEIDEFDVTLPLPLRGSVCHGLTCYGMPTFDGGRGEL